MVREWWTVTGALGRRTLGNPRGAGWRVVRADPRELPDGVALWSSEEDATMAACYLHDHRAVARGIPHRHTHVVRRRTGRPGRAVPSPEYAAHLAVCAFAASLTSAP